MKQPSEKKKNHIGRRILIVVAGILLVLAMIIIGFGLHNGRLMNNSIDAGLDTLKDYYSVTEVSAGDYETLRLYGIMTFRVKQYEVEGLGNLCVMTTNMGLMQMATFVLTPYEKDMPMMSTDFMYMFGIRKGYVELYNLTEDVESESFQGVLSALRDTLDDFSDLADCEPGSGWYDYLLTTDAYKQGSAKQDDRFHELFRSSVETYAEASAAMEAMTPEARGVKLGIIRDYCDAMVEKGGISTTIFKKALGDDVTRDFFENVFFGPATRAE